ncbi:MAG: AAA family ATPase [Oryzihumus sp.]
MTLLWDQDPNSPDTYRYALGTVERLDTAPLVLRALAAAPQELLVVVGPDVDLQAVCDLAQQIRVDRPEVGVIMLRRRLDVTVMGQALRSGVREVVPADDQNALADTCRRNIELSKRLRGASGGPVHEGRVVTVFSAKGGVGKTTFSTNLGACLASTGVRVLLIDLDLGFGDVAISLQLMHERSMSDVVAMSGALDEQGLASVVTRHESGLDALCAPSEPGDVDRISGATVSEVIRVARRMYDVVLIDTPPAFTEHVLVGFDASDLLVLIATLDIPALKNLRVTLDTLDLLGNPRDSRVVVLNRSDAKVGLTHEDVVRTIKQPIAVSVPSSHSVPASVNRGVPIVLNEPKHPVSVAIRTLVDRHIRPLLNREPELATAGPRSTGAGEAPPNPPRTRREMRFLHRGGKR